MAGSRLEKIGTIYTRVTGLIKSGAVKWEDRPLWYDVYEAFPPADEPRFDRPAPNIPLRKIFYEEDKIRALLHNNNKRTGAVNLFNNSPKYKTLTQRFIETYKKLETQFDGKATQEQLYKETIDMLQREREAKKDEDPEDISLSTAFRAAEDKQSPSLNIKVSELFK